jgi:hypothetical protein
MHFNRSRSRIANVTFVFCRICSLQTPKRDPEATRLTHQSGHLNLARKHGDRKLRCSHRANLRITSVFYDVLFPTNDLVMTTSTDGTHWSTIQRIPIDPVTSSVDHVIPGLGAFSGDGSRTKLTLTYYSIDNGTLCVPANCDLNAAYISSDDGGKSWHKAHKVAGPMMQTWLASTYAGQMVSDYLTVAFVNGQPFGTFALANAPNAQTGELDEAIYAIPLQDD